MASASGHGPPGRPALLCAHAERELQDFVVCELLVGPVGADAEFSGELLGVREADGEAQAMAAAAVRSGLRIASL